MILDEKKIYEKYDKGMVAASISLLGDQIRQALSDSRLVKIPKEYSGAKQIVVSGMGGSNLAAHIIKSSLSDQLSAPVEINAGYDVPAHVGKSTLFILSSYSGNTEETISTYAKARKKGAKIMVITAHGEKNSLEKTALRDNIPGYIFTPECNPSGQPRLGLGYSYFGLAVLLAKSGFFKISVREVEKIISLMELRTRQLNVNEPSEINDAKKLAAALNGYAPVLVGAEHLAGNLHALRNQLNENAKLFSAYLVIPDLNHHAMEGLVFPKSNPKNIAFIFFDSVLYDKKIKKRIDLTKKVVEKNGIAAFGAEMSFRNRFAESFELLQFGTWLSFYLGILNKVNPSEIPWVDWFKENMKK